MSALSIFILFFSLSLTVFSASTLKTFPVPSGSPESFIFSPTGELFTGVNDGRVVKYRGPNVKYRGPWVLGWTDFSYASPTRTSKQCEGTKDPALGSICGRTLGLGMNYKTNELYLADAYHGLLVVGPEGGLAKQLLSHAGGNPLKWLDGIDVDQTTGNVYFTDASSVYNFSQVALHLSSGDSTGRLIEYNVKTKQARVLLTGLKGPGGTGVAKDGSFVLVSELPGNKISKYWLKGPKANTVELVMNIPAPANIKRTGQGDFWVAINVPENSIIVPTGMRIDESGKVLEEVRFEFPINNTYITEVHQHRDKLYIASLIVDFGLVY